MAIMPPKNGIYIVQGEINLVVTAMRRSSRWTTHSHQDDEQDPLLNTFSQLKDILTNITELEEIEPNVFLGPFLDVIRSEDTTGPITGLALSSVNKFLSYGLVDPGCDTAAAAIENIADAVTHARFVGTDPGSDEVVLMKILHVLRTLLLTPAGAKLTNESVCEIMQSCFRICFEMRLSELLRKSAEHTLMDMVQLLFTRLPQFKEDSKWVQNLTKKLKMRASGMDPTRGSKKKRSPKPRQRRVQSNVQQTPASQPPHSGIPEERQSDLSASDERTDSMEIEKTDVPAALQGIDQTEAPNDQTVGREDSLPPGDEYPDPDLAGVTIATTPVAPSTTVVDIHGSFQERYEEERDEQERKDESKSELTESMEMAPNGNMLSVPGDMDSKKSGSETELDQLSCPSEVGDDQESVVSAAETSDAASLPEAEFVGPRGVRFTPQQFKEGFGPMIPYGLPCVRELFRFLISLTNPVDRHNNDVMIHMGLSLLTVALESGADNVGQFNSLIGLVKDDMCKHLFALLQSERLSLFSASLRVCFLLFESMRSHLKLQLEMYLTKLMDIIVSESVRISYEQREIALESVVQLWRIPGLVTELYLNYDCDIYCSNLFEDLTKLLSKNAFPVSGLFTTHLLSLDSLLTVIDSIEQHCHSRILNATKLTDPEQKSSVKFAVHDGEVKAEDEENTSGEFESIPPVPALSGYSVGQKIPVTKDQESDSTKLKTKDGKRGPVIKPNRMKVTSRLPTEEELATIKRKKKLLHTGTEQFNIKPSKGIAFLQEHGLMSSPLDPGEVVMFLKENPRLDKKMIGEFIASKKNAIVLEAFVKSFMFEDLRVDEALRLYLETFRLPGEAPVISYLLEHFAEHWHKTNCEPFHNADCAFTLAYAVIMLNVDQHNHNVKKQSVPMTIHEFRKNLKGVNGNRNFEDEMLEEIYAAIKSDEIVMPAEQSGQVRENYCWKVLLRRGTDREGMFLHTPTGSFDHDLFTLIWGPTVAALSFVFDKSLDETIVQKAISGFRKCAMISAHYGLSDVFDNLVISLCKFTTLLSAPESPENIPILFGNNQKAQLAARTVFGLAHRHGDILREGWKNILDCLLQLYRAKMLPKVLVEVEDFLDPNGKVSLIKEDVGANQRQDSGVLSSFYSYFALSDNTTQRGPTPEEQEAIKISHSCIRDCHIEQLILDTKFLRMDSLQELIKALLFAAQCHLHNDNIGTHYDEDASVFYLEQLIRVVLQNRDRVAPIWQSVRDYFYNILVNASEPSFLVERAVVGLMRLAIRLLRREDIAPQVLTTLRIFLMMKPAVIHSVCRQVSFGQHELLRTNAANIHSAMDWYTLFTLLEVVGAGCTPPPMSGDGEIQEVAVSDGGAQSDSEISSMISEAEGDKGYTSDSELYEPRTSRSRSTPELDVRPAPGGGSWLLVNKNKFEDKPVNQFNIVLNEEIKHHDTKSLLKSCETLAFLVRDAAHVTPHNFQSCVHCIRTFVEAGLNGGVPVRQPKQHNPKDKKRKGSMKRSRSSPSHLVNHTSDDEAEGEGTTGGYHSLSIQLLDLMHTLHTRAASIFSSWAEEEKAANGQNIYAGTGTLWVQCWCPLLQGIARLCCDTRRQVRSQALTYLQRALLVHDLQTLSAMEWESCFNQVLFPLLSKLLDNINLQDPNGLEETRMRAATLLCKVFLQHLTPLLSLSTFTALWLTILEFMDKYMHADKSDLLYEAIPESLKNMLLVMDTAGIFELTETEESQLWKLTWDKIDTFLPNLREEVFKPHNKHDKDRSRGSQPPPPTGDTPSSTQTAPSEPPVTTATTTQPVSQEPVESDKRPSSPLTSATVPKSSGYILHPPLPDTFLAGKMPILLNPDVMQHTTIPIISPQGTPERVGSPSVVAESR